MYNNFFNSFLMAFVPYGIVPINELYAWSNNQKIHILFHKIAELVEASNGYDKLFEEIKGLLVDFDDTMKKQLEELLQAMYDDGSLADMLGNIAEEYFENITAPKTFKIDTRREFRIARQVMPYNATTTSGEWYSYCQGGRMFKRFNTLYYVCCLKPSRTDNAYYNNDNCDVRLYMYNNTDGKWEFVRNNIYSFGHANDICYCEKMDKFIVAFGTTYDSNAHKNVPVKTWAILDFALPNDTAIVVTNPTLFSDEPNGGLSTVDYYDNKIWFGRGAGGSGTTMKIDTLEIPDEWDNYSWTMNETEQYARFKTLTSNTPYVMVMAGFCQNDDYIFLGNTAPNGIYRFNKHTKKLDCFYEIGNYTNNHMYPTGEMENLSCVDDVLYIGCAIHGNQELWYYDYTQVFSFDFINNSRVPNQVTTAYGGTYRVINLGTQHYTLDQENNKVWSYDTVSINASKREISNPNGLEGNYGEPFPTWEEAIQFINAQELWSTIQIRQKTQYMVEYVCINSNKNIFIDGVWFYNNHSELAEAERYPRVGGLYIDGTNICIDHTWIQNLSPLNLTAYSRHQVFVRNSNCAIHSSIFYVTGRSGLGVVYDNNIFSINRSFANISYNRPVTWDSANSQFTIGSKYIYSTTEGTGTTSDPYRLKWINPYESTINALGDYVSNPPNTNNFDKYFILS